MGCARPRRRRVAGARAASHLGQQLFLALGHARAELVETDPSTDEFSAKAKVLKELIEHHADEEEKEMFPRARELLGLDALRELGERMQARKEELMADPSLLEQDEAEGPGLLGSVVSAMSTEAEDEPGLAPDGLPPGAPRNNGRGQANPTGRDAR